MSPGEADLAAASTPLWQATPSRCHTVHADMLVLHKLACLHSLCTLTCLYPTCRPTPTTPHSGSDSPPDSIELPDSVIEAMLRRELLLTNAKLHGLGNEHITSERKLRSLRTQLRQVRSPGSRRMSPSV